MNSLKSWLCLLLLFALSLFGTRASHAKVILTISKPAPTPAVVVTSRVVKQDDTHLTVNLSVSNRQKTWYYVNASKHSKGSNVPARFLLGPSQTYTIKNVELIPSQSGSFAADSSLTKYKEVSWTLGIDAAYRVGLGTSLPVKFHSSLENLLTLLKQVQAKNPSVPANHVADATSLLSSLKVYIDALKRKNVTAASKSLQDLVSSPLIIAMLGSVDQATATKFKNNIAKLDPNSAKFLTSAGRVVNAQLTALNAPKTDGVTYSTQFFGPPELVVSDTTVRENDSSLYFRLEVKLSNAWEKAVSANFSVADGTAKDEQDYVLQDYDGQDDNGGTLSFSPGTTSQTIVFEISGDTKNGPDKYFTVSFSNPSSDLTIPKNTITVTIADDEIISTTPSNDGKITYVFDGDIYVVNADGTNKTRLTSDSKSSDPAFSSDGGKIAFTSTRDGNGEIYVMDANGKNQTRVTKNPGYDGQPAFSPNGRQIAFTNGAGIYLMNANGTGQIQVTDADSNGSLYDSEPTFTPDGNQIAFTSEFPYPRGDQYYNEAFLVNTDGTGQTYLLNGPPADRDPAFSRDGSKIAFVYSSNIYVINPDLTGQIQLTNFDWSGEDDARSLSFSPDGSKIAFGRTFWTSDPYTRIPGSIYIANVDGTNLTAFVEGLQPSWAPGSVPAPSITAPASRTRSTFPSGGAS